MQDLERISGRANVGRLLKVLSLAVLSVVLVVAAGCRSFPAKKTQYGPGSILVLPTRDVVQNGQPHEYSPGTGARFSDVLVTRLNRTSFSAVTTDNAAFNHTEVPSQAAMLEEARAKGADYVFHAVLGEFLNAAPMSFRSDYVQTDKAFMLDTKTGTMVWELTRQLYDKKGNMGNHMGLIDRHAIQIQQSIAPK